LRRGARNGKLQEIIIGQPKEPIPLCATLAHRRFSDSRRSLCFIIRESVF